MASRPLVGLTTSVTFGSSPERAYVNAAYVRAVQAAGGAPVLLPPHLDEATRAALWTRLDALVLSGGGDVDPARFGEPPHAKVYEVSPERARKRHRPQPEGAASPTDPPGEGHGRRHAPGLRGGRDRARGELVPSPS